MVQTLSSPGLTTGNAPFVEEARNRGDLYITQAYELYSEENHEAWRRLYFNYEMRRAEFSSRYHVRSNIESTFSALKRKFGSFVRSKLPAAQLNEVLLKCLVYNLSVLVRSIHVLRIEPKFWMPRGER